jgi:hypothetical protein
VPKPREHRTHELFDAVHRRGTLDVYAFAEATWGPEPQALGDARVVAEELVTQRLARWSDAPRTTLELTAFGRYWAAHGGYFGYLASDAPALVPARGERERGERGERGEDADADPDVRRELQRLRLDLMRKRLRTFWWGFGISILSLAMSMVSLYLVVSGKR